VAERKTDITKPYVSSRGVGERKTDIRKQYVSSRREESIINQCRQIFQWMPP
jgi:hypothetical protein